MAPWLTLEAPYSCEVLPRLRESQEAEGGKDRLPRLPVGMGDIWGGKMWDAVVHLGRF